MDKIRISVRSLVEFILREGDIDNRRDGVADREAMQIGSRLHRKIQGRMGASYRPEVALKEELDCEDYTISVEGRADGIFTEEEFTWIDEIKGTGRDVNRLEEPVPVHLAQAKCYAYMYASQNDLEVIGVQLTYVHMETEEIRRLRREFAFEELRLWFAELMERYRVWADFQIRWRRRRQESIGPVVFPYPYREGQKALAGAVYRTIQREKKLFIQAPTGVGKTIATVFPAIKAVGEGLGEKIFYLTAKTITRTVAQETFSLLKTQGLAYKVITLTAKEKICICQEPDCNPQSCPYAKGHYDRVNDAVYDLLQDEEGNYTRERILQQAEKFQVCPFELSLDTALWSDAVICDYNYVFDPQAKLKRFFGDGVKGDYIFLIDEAHNLVERGREMYSAALYKEDFLEIKRLLKPLSKKAERALERCNRYLLELKRECEDYTLLTDIGAFSISLMNACTQLESLLEDPQGVLNFYDRAGSPFESREEMSRIRRQVLDFYFQVRSFLSIYEEMDDGYQIYAQQEEQGRFMLKLFCIHTAGKIGECLSKGRGSILFSATLLPVRYYMELLSGTSEDYAVYAESPFDSGKKQVLIASDVSSRYTRRNQAEYRRIARYIYQCIRTKPGNYLAFFPSYKMLEEIREIFEDEIETLLKPLPEEIRVIAQNSRMTEEQREEFLENFSREEQKGSLVGFCVMGGIFGEGIDLKREQLIGAVIVGTGLPQVCSEREILKKYYDEKKLDGFSYAYQYPGMNKVLQSAGRVIRTDEDRGVMLLLDDRFCRRQYLEIFPREWADYEVCTLQSVERKLADFWKKGE